MREMNARAENEEIKINLQRRKALESLEKRADNDEKRKLPAPDSGILTFRRWTDMRQEDGRIQTCIDPNGPPPVSIDLAEKVGKKDQHYYIYSPTNYGKTHVLHHEVLKKTYSVFVPDPKNARGVREKAKGLVFDDFTPKRKLGLAHLMSITSGTGTDGCSFASLNRKRGKRYPVEPNARIFILSNHSPYEIYADGRTKQISQNDADSLNARFTIVKLGGGKVIDDYNRFVRKIYNIGEWRAEIINVIQTRMNKTTPSERTACFIIGCVKAVIELITTHFLHVEITYEDLVEIFNSQIEGLDAQWRIALTGLAGKKGQIQGGRYVVKKAQVKKFMNETEVKVWDSLNRASEVVRDESEESFVNKTFLDDAEKQEKGFIVKQDGKRKRSWQSTTPCREDGESISKRKRTC